MGTRSANCLLRFCLILLEMLPVSNGFAVGPDDKRPKVDQYGDPLPPSARLRLGTIRLRHGSEIRSIAYSPGGQVVVTAGHDNKISLWDIVSGKGLARFHAPGCVAMAFARDGKSFVWCDVGGTLYRCDAGQRGEDLPGQREQLHRFTLGSSERIEAAAFALDGSAALAI
jgi:WD40 repeat protein